MLDGRLNQYWKVLARNYGRARRRVLGPEHFQGQLNLDPIIWDGGAILHFPSGDWDPPVILWGAHA